MICGYLFAANSADQPISLDQAVKGGCQFATAPALLNHLLQDQGDVLVRNVRDATGQPPPGMAGHDRDGLRQATEELSLVLRDLAALQERIKLLQE